MLPSSALQNSSLSFKSTTNKNATFYQLFYQCEKEKGQYFWPIYMVNTFRLQKLGIQTHFKHQIKYVMCVTCKICLISTKHCLI